MTTKIQTVAELIAGLPEDRRREVEQVRKVIRSHLPKGYEEVVTKDILVYQVPLEKFPDTYNGQPLWYAALSSNKTGLSLHLMNAYTDKAQTRRLEQGFKAAGKKLDMGKACVRFKTAKDLPLEVIGEVIASTPMERWIAIAKAARKR